MILFAILVILIGAAIALGFRFSNAPNGSYSGDAPSDRTLWWVWSISILFVPYFIVSIIWAGNQYANAADITNSQYVIEQLDQQRNELAAALKENLTSEDFARLMESATPEDLAFLKNNPQVSDFMLGRADRIVGINSRLYAEQNKLLDKARGVCNYTDNPLIPKFPFLGPDCSLGTLKDSFKTPDGETTD